MKILGLGVPELLILLVVIVIILVVIVAIQAGRSSQNTGSQPVTPPLPYTQNATPAQQTMSPQELERYAQLLKEGALSQQEFDEIKAKYLNSTR